MAELVKAPDVADVAQPLMQQHHPHLLDKCSVEFLFLEAETSADIGKVKRVGDDVKLVAEDAPDFIVTVWRSWWDDADVQQRLALVDHLLCHCGWSVAKEKTLLEKHDFEGFRDEVERHGAWSPQLTEVERQLNLFVPGIGSIDGMDEADVDEAVERVVGDQFLRHAQALCPKPGSGVESVTISSGGRPGVTLTAEDGKKIAAMRAADM